MSNSAQVERILFVYSKKGRVKCYSLEEIRGKEVQMALDDWKHTATIDPARWIESLCNGRSAPSDLIDEIQLGP